MQNIVNFSDSIFNKLEITHKFDNISTAYKTVSIDVEVKGFKKSAIILDCR